MEGEERPRKLVKLDHDRPQEEQQPEVTDTMTETEKAQEQHADGNDVPDNEPSNGSENGSKDEAPAEGDEAPKMSKRQMKKRQRQEKWEAGRDERKAKRKEQLAARRQRKREEFKQAKAEGRGAEVRKAMLSTKQRFQRSKLLPVTFILDCGWDELMHDRERISLAQQLTRCYSDNARNPYRSHLVLSSFDKLLKERFDTVLKSMYLNWQGVRFFDEDYVHAAEQAKGWMAGPEGGQMVGMFADKTGTKPEDGEVIYLSSDSPNTLTELKPYSTYIIGGLVDKNRHKGVCYKRAVEKGLQTAKLPIGDYIQMASRSVLTTNHVMEIMLRWLERGDWGQAFMDVIPQRKGGALKTRQEEQAEEEAEEAAEAEVGAEVEAEALAENEPQAAEDATTTNETDNS